MKKIILAISLFFIFCATLLLMGSFSKEDEILGLEEAEKEILSVAVCPSFYNLLSGNGSIDIIKTDSTSESLELIEKGEVDAVISGRALKKEEPQLSYQIIGDGYDFLYKDEVIILEKEMEFIPFFTNIDVDKIISDFQYISKENILKVDNVFDYLEEGVVITLLEDKLIGEVAHILKEDGTRVYLSRRPRIYYLGEEVKNEVINNILEQ
jgi:hypothetical protein